MKGVTTGSLRVASEGEKTLLNFAPSLRLIGRHVLCCHVSVSRVVLTRALFLSVPRAVRWSDYCSRTLNLFYFSLRFSCWRSPLPYHDLNESYRIRLRSSGALNMPGPMHLVFLSP